MKHTTVSNTAPIVDASWQWLALALFSQFGWGAYPVFARYLQTVTGLPSMSLLAVGNAIVLLIVGVLILPKLDKAVFRQPIVWGFGVIVSVRGITNLLAVRYTLATYAQLIYLFTPFLVVLLAWLFFKQQAPRYTKRAITICLLGALLMMSDDLRTVGSGLTADDGLGMGLALGSSLALAIYMILVRQAKHVAVSPQALLIVQLTSLLLFAGTTSVLWQEDWSRWGSLTAVDLWVFAGCTFLVILGANFGQILSIQRLGASFVSSLMATRLISALLFAFFLLGEQFTQPLQLLGIGLVFVTVTWYLQRQNKAGREAKSLAPNLTNESPKGVQAHPVDGSHTVP